MTAYFAPPGKFQAFKLSGAVMSPAAGYYLHTYEAGTTTPLATYTTRAAGTPNANPVVLDSSGQADVWMTTAAYKFVLKTPAGATVWTTDNLYAPEEAGVAATFDTAMRADLASATDLAKGAGLSGYKVSDTTGFLTGATARTVRKKLDDFVSVFDFMSAAQIADVRAGTGAVDVTTAVQAAIDASYTRANKTVHFPNGTYKLTSTITITQGVMLMCEGSQGSTSGYGATFYCYHNSHGFLWDGSGAQYSGTGGGLQNALILKATGYTGGSGIKLLATSDDYRPGEMVFNNVLIYGSGTGMWEYVLHVDGSACNTAGGRGVRHIHLFKFRVASGTTANAYVYLNQVTHFFATGLAIDQGNGSGTPGITFAGTNDSVFIDGLDCIGGIVIPAFVAVGTTAVNNLHINGKCQGGFSNSDNQVEGVVTLSGPNAVVNASKKLHVTVDSLNAEFYMTMAASVADVTGDGTLYTLVWDNIVTNRSGDASSGGYTCNQAGYHQFNLGIVLKDVASAHTYGIVRAVITDAVSGSRNIDFPLNPYTISYDAGGGVIYAGCNVSFGINLAKAASVVIKVVVSNGTKVIDIYGGGTDYTYFSGRLIP